MMNVNIKPDKLSVHITQ